MLDPSQQTNPGSVTLWRSGFHYGKGKITNSPNRN
jgi:hypothetical protein